MQKATFDTKIQTGVSCISEKCKYLNDKMKTLVSNESVLIILQSNRITN